MRRLVLTDSGYTDSSIQPILYRSQLNMIKDIFSKLEKQCEKLKQESSDCWNEKWFNDLEIWKHRVQYRLDILQKQLCIDSDTAVSVPPHTYSKSIIFRPSNAEVKAIIANVNEKFKCAK